MTTSRSADPSATLRMALRLGATLLVLSPVALTAAAPQQDRSRALEQLLRRFDKNLDGKVDRDEYPRPPRSFRRFDRNGDGFISRDDLEATPGSEPTAEIPAVERRPPTQEEVEFFETRVETR